MTPAYAQPTAGMPPKAASTTAPITAATANCPHSAMNGAALRLATRFQPACSTAAARAMTVATTTGGFSPSPCQDVLMLLTEIDHVAIAVSDLEAAIDYYERAFGATVTHREVVERDGVEEALLKVAESYIQLSAAIRESSPIARFIEKRGEGIHHVAYRVDDCAVALAAMVAVGATPIDPEPRPGSRGTTVAFIHPKGSFGTLIELVQE